MFTIHHLPFSRCSLFSINHLRHTDNGNRTIENARKKENRKQIVDSSGFTMVEIITSIVIMGIIIPSVAYALTSLAVVDHEARDKTLANFIAQNKIETLRSVGYNGLTPGTVSFTSNLPNTMGSPKNASYTVSANTPTTGVAQIDISISYTEYNHMRSLSYRSYISELGVGQ